MSAITSRQREAMLWISETRAARGFSPTIAELAAWMSIRSKNGVADHLRALKRKGLVTWEPHRARTLLLTTQGRRALASPEAGR